MVEEIYFALVGIVLLLCLTLFKGAKDHKKRVMKHYLEEMKIQEEITQSNLKK